MARSLELIFNKIPGLPDVSASPSSRGSISRSMRIRQPPSRVGFGQEVWASPRGGKESLRPQESESRTKTGDKMVGPVGLEPTTRGLKVRCSAS